MFETLPQIFSAGLLPHLQDDVLEVPVLAQMSQDRLDLADDHLEHVDLAVEDIDDVVLNSVLHGKIEDKDVAGLADPVKSSDPLLDPHGVPREVEVDDGVAELKIPALSAGLRGDENRNVAPERRDCGVLFLERHVSPEHDEGDVVPLQKTGDVIYALDELGEDDLLLAWVLREYLHERRALADVAEVADGLDDAVCAVLSVHGEERLLQGKGAAPGLPQKKIDRLLLKPVFSDKSVKTRINLPFRLRWFEPDGRGEPLRELEIDGAPCISDHHVAQQRLQPVLVRRCLQAPLLKIVLLELFFRLKLSRLQNGNEIKQLDEVVLDRRGREQQYELFLELIHELPREGGPVLEVVRLVHHHEIVELLRDQRHVFGALRRIERRDNEPLFPEAGRVACELLIVRGQKLDAEFGLHLFLPLRDEGRRGQDQDVLHHAPHEVLLDEHPRLDGLPEADLVAEEGPPVKQLEHLLHGLDLMPVFFHGRRRVQAQKLVEAALDGEKGVINKQQRLFEGRYSLLEKGCYRLALQKLDLHGDAVGGDRDDRCRGWGGGFLLALFNELNLSCFRTRCLRAFILRFIYPPFFLGRNSYRQALNDTLVYRFALLVPDEAFKIGECLPRPTFGPDMGLHFLKLFRFFQVLFRFCNVSQLCLHLTKQHVVEPV